MDLTTSQIALVASSRGGVGGMEHAGCGRGQNTFIYQRVIKFKAMIH